MRRPVPFVVLVRLLAIIVVGLMGLPAFASPVEAGSVSDVQGTAMVHAIGTDRARDAPTSAGTMLPDVSHGWIPHGSSGHGEAGAHGSGCAHSGGACPGACAASAGALLAGWRHCIANGATHGSVAGRSASVARARAPEAPFRPPILG